MASGDPDRRHGRQTRPEGWRRRAPGPAGVGPGPQAADPLHDGLEKVDRMIAAGRRLGYTVAADNLRNWRDRGGNRQLPASAFQSESFLLEHLQTRHRPRFVDGARRRVYSGELAVGRDALMEWTDSVNAPYMTDLFFALGGFTVHSRVTVGVTPLGDSPNRFTLRFKTWDVDIRDTYDWDPGKSTLIPGVGRVTDAEMLALERAGYGRSFEVTSDVARVTDRDITRDATIP